VYHYLQALTLKLAVREPDTQQNDSLGLKKNTQNNTQTKNETGGTRQEIQWKTEKYM